MSNQALFAMMLEIVANSIIPTASKHSATLDGLPQRYGVWEVLSSGRDQKVVVADGVLDHTISEVLLEYVSEYWTWRYKEQDQCESCTRGHWTAKLHTSRLHQTRFLNTTRGFVQQAYGDSSLQLQDIRARAIRRGDINFVEHAASDNGAFILVLFLSHNKHWLENDSGELILWDTDGMVVTSTHPKFGRMLLYPSSMSVLYKPPSMATVATQIIIQLLFTSKLDDEQQSFLIEGDNVGNEFGFPLANFQTSQLTDVESHITRKYSSNEGLNVIVLDDIFSQEDLDVLRSFILENGTYTFDLSEDSSDNVKWVTGYEVTAFAKSGIWALTKQVVDHVVGRDDYYPYDVTCNLIRTFDHPQIHTDSEPWVNGYTFLLYLNPNWTSDWHGETSFYDNDGEPFAAVQPRYGRVALFHGAILHSGHPPSVIFSRARLTFAVKMLPEKEAREHLKQEELHGIEDIMGLLKPDEARQLEEAIREVEEGNRNLKWLVEIIDRASKTSVDLLLKKI